MSRRARRIARFAVTIGVLAALPLAFAPSWPAPTPCLSALSDLSAAPALAAAHCPNRACRPTGRHA